VAVAWSVSARPGWERDLPLSRWREPAKSAVAHAL